MSTATKPNPQHAVIKAAMAVAKDVAEGRLSPAAVDDAALDACRALFGTVAGPHDPLWPLQCEVARQVLAAGGVPANELQEWLAVQRAREPQAEVDVPKWAGGGSWIEQALAAAADDEELADA